MIGAYAAHRGFKALLAGLTFIHDEDEPHGFLRFNLLAFLVAVAAFALFTVVSGVIELEQDPSTPTGLRWTGGSGYPERLSAGTLCDVDVVTEDVAPMTLFLPWLRQAFGG